MCGRVGCVGGGMNAGWWERMDKQRADIRQLYRECRPVRDAA